MFIADPFIKRPVASSLLAIGIVLLGLLAFRMLPVAPLPQVDFPAVQIYAGLPGASPESMAATVATPLERALGKWSLWRPGNLRAWLFSIMHNLFVNQARSPRLVDYPGDDALPDLRVDAVALSERCADETDFNVLGIQPGSVEGAELGAFFQPGLAGGLTV